VLAAATLLAPPYLLTYDGVLLGLPVAWLLLHGGRPRTAMLVWGLSFLTIIAVAGFYEFPNTLSLGALVALAGCYFSQDSKKKAAAPYSTAASV